MAQLAEGINNAGSALAAANNTVEQSFALLTAAQTTVQDISKASTALRTMAARIRRTDASAMPEGEEAITASKYDELVKSLTKYRVALVDANNEYRSTYDIIKDIAAAWDEMSSMEQAALAETIAGTRNQNIFFSLVEQFQEAEGAFEAAQNAAGAMGKAYQVYEQSIQYNIDQLTAAFQKFSVDFINSDTVKHILDFATGITNVADGISRVNALLPLTITLVTALKSVTRFKQANLKCRGHVSFAREGSYPVKAGRSEFAA